MIEWWSQNWGNVASLMGLLLSIPSLWFSFWAWKEAKSAEQMVAFWHERQALLIAERALDSSIRACRRLRKTNARTWPRTTRTELRDSLLEVLHGVEWPEEIRCRLGPMIAELRHEITTSTGTSTYLEVIIDVIVECRAIVRSRMQKDAS